MFRVWVLVLFPLVQGFGAGVPVACISANSLGSGSLELVFRWVAGIQANSSGFGSLELFPLGWVLELVFQSLVFRPIVQVLELVFR